MTWNGTYLPEITSMYKAEAIEALEYDFIYNYEFEYVLDDEQPEDMVAGYDGFEAGDPAIEEGTITVLLYKNSFTDVSSSIFFSKYLEGSGNDRALEIYNPTDEAVDLSAFHISIFSDGAFDNPYRISLEGMLEADDTYTIVYSGSSQDLLALADQQSTRLIFDGNDVIQLRFDNETYLDSIFDLGNKLFLMQNELFVRDENTVKGSRVFVTNDWDGYVPDYVEIFGTFPVAKPESFTINEAYLYNQIGSTSVSGMAEVTLEHISDGDTAAFYPDYLNDARVRFLGTDTPETNKPYEWNDEEDGVWEAEPWGLEAKAFTLNALESATTIYLQSDPDLGFKETYGRTLAYVWADGVMINYELVKNGYSYNYLSTESKLVFEHRYLYRWFQDAETYARENELGIHS
jgi:endonuclease YncB( thermonuclease family)